MNTSTISQMSILIEQLNKASEAYYKYDNPIMTDREYDKLYDELSALESESGITYPDSPTQKVQGSLLTGLNKVTHSKPMLSAAKTKDINICKSFVENKDYYVSYKLDGLTLVVKYDNGKFVQAITRGNGTTGEDVTEAAKLIQNLPMTISYKGYLELRGECLISWETFNKINATLEVPYKHPRNLAAGTLRSFNTQVVKDRGLIFIVFETVSYDKKSDYNSKYQLLNIIDSLGFTTVPCSIINDDIDKTIKAMSPENCIYPVDGLIFELDDIKLSESLGATAHHENCRLALKWKDESEETTLRDIEWQIGRTGVLTPVAVFDAVELDGTTVTQALVHNISYIEDMGLNVGDSIAVAKMNQIIPQIVENYSRNEMTSYEIPKQCPYCHSDTIVKQISDTKVLYCSNNKCSGKLLRMFSWFVSKPCMNINGLSEATLEKLINMGVLNTYKDLYHLDDCKNTIISSNVGIGEKSYQGMLDSIRASRHCKLENFITALGIPTIGKSTAKTIKKACNGSWNEFVNQIKLGFDFSTLDDIGTVSNLAIYDWYNDSDGLKYMWDSCSEELIFEPVEAVQADNNAFFEKTVVITGSFTTHTREQLQQILESMGAKVSNSVSKKTNYLLKGDKAGSKLAKAEALGIQIITEEEFMQMIM